MRNRSGYRRRGETRAAQPQNQTAAQVAEKEACMANEQKVEILQRLIAFACSRLHFFEYKGVATDRALAVDNHVARQNVRAFHGNGHRDGFVYARQIIVRAQHDAASTVYVHGVVNGAAHGLGQVVFDNGGNHGRLDMLVQGGQGQGARRISHISQAADAPQHFLYALELAHGYLELAAHGGIGAGGAAGEFAGAGAERRQRHAAAFGQAFHQHAPALAGVFPATDQPVQRDEYIPARVGTVLEGYVHRIVTAADGNARRIGGDQRQGDADVFFIAEQMIRVIQLERQPQQGGDRPEGNIAFFPVQADAGDFLAPEFPLADDAGVGHGAGIAAGERPGEGETGNLAAIGQTRQKILFLFLRAVAHDQLARPQRIGHHHGDGGGDAARCQFHDHGGMGQGGKSQTAVFFGNDHAEELFLFDVGPGFRCQVFQGVGDFPVVQHVA